MKNTKLELFNKIQHFDVFSSNKHMHDLNLISTSFRMLMPEFNFEEQLSFSKEMAFYQIISKKDEKNLSLIKKVKKPLIDLNNQILVTFHFSSYRLLNSLLVNWEIPFKIITDSNYIKNQGDRTLKTYSELTEELSVKKFKFEIINAEDRTVLLKCLKAVREGYTLLFYADGNSGVGGMTKNPNMLKIPFLNSSIYVRKGIAMLASMIKKPITTLIVNNDFKKKQVKIEYKNMIKFPSDRNNRSEIFECTKEIFSFLENEIKKKPGAWEGWFYYHNFIDFQLSSKRRYLSNHVKNNKIFNHYDFGIGTIKEKLFYLIDKINFKIIPIDKKLFDQLLFIIIHDKVEKQHPVFKSLANKKVLKLDRFK